MQNLVQEHVDQWISKYPRLARLFNEEKIIKPCLKICEIVTEKHPNRIELVSNFIMGLIFVAASLKEEDKDGEFLGNHADRLTKPVFDIVSNIVKSDSYKEKVIDSANLGDTVQRGQISIPVTKERIMAFVNQKSVLIYIREDVVSIVQDFLKDREEFYMPQPKPEKTKKAIDDISLNDFCHEGAKDEIISVLSGFHVIDSKSKAWTFRSTGYKGTAATLIKIFNARNYFKKVPDNDEYRAIFKNEFGLEISERTMAGAKPDENFLEGRMKGIPLFEPKKT